MKLISIIIQFKYILENYGYSREGLLKEKEKYPHLSNEDFIWGKFNEMLTRADGSSLQRLPESVYHSMGTFRVRVENKDPNPCHRLRIQAELERVKEEQKQRTGVEQEISIIPCDDCGFVRNLASTRVDIDNPIISELAGEKCDRNLGCSCSLCLVPKRDANGKLIWTEDVDSAPQKKKTLWEQLKDFF